MKSYAYFPGCSLEKMAGSYDVSTRKVAEALGIELREIEDWNCCGATAYFHVDELLATALCSRNIAIAEREGLDLVAPCSGCFKNMFVTNAHLKEDADLREHMNFALEEDGLKVDGTIRVRHLVEVLHEDVGPEGVRAKVKRPLKGLRVAPYYGCQLVRPRKTGAAEEENPTLYEELLRAMGATPVEYPPRLRCCGGSLVITNREAALAMVQELLKSAVQSRADVIATMCPLCQTNLECYQGQVSRRYGARYSIPVLYFTQLLGVALGFSPKEMKIGTELVGGTEELFREKAEPQQEQKPPAAAAARSAAR